MIGWLSLGQKEETVYGSVIVTFRLYRCERTAIFPPESTLSIIRSESGWGSPSHQMTRFTSSRRTPSVLSSHTSATRRLEVCLHNNLLPAPCTPHNCQSASARKQIFLHSTRMVNAECYHSYYFSLKTSLESDEENDWLNSGHHHSLVHSVH